MWALMAADGRAIDSVWLVEPVDTTGYVEAPDHVLPDWTLDDGVWSPPAPTPPAPPASEELTVERIRLALKATGKTDTQIDALFALASAI